MNGEFGASWAAEAASWKGGTFDQGSGLVEWDVEKGLLELDVGRGDWRGRALQLNLRSTRRTGARIDLQVLDGEGDVVATTRFVADWIGDNHMQLWLHAFEPRTAGERLRDIHRMRLVCIDPGLWPTRLQMGRVTLTDQINGWDVNDSDTVIDMAWREITANPDAWRMVDTGTGLPSDSGAEQHWDHFGYVFSFRQGANPGRIVVEREFDLDLSGFHEILAKLTWDKECGLTVVACVDGGREIHLIKDERPFGSSYCTVGAALLGARRLERIRLELAERPDRTLEDRQIGMDLLWILLRRPTEQDQSPVETVTVRMAGTHAPYPAHVATTQRRVQQIPSPEAESAPSSDARDPMTDGLPFGFYISRSNLSGLRQAVHQSPAKEAYAELMAEADRAIATELVDRNYYGSEFGGGIGLPKGLRGAGMRVFAPTVAVAHLLTGDPRYAEAGRRWILRTARSDDWRGDHGGCVDRPQVGEVLSYWDSFTGWYPLGFSGHMNHHFWVADVAHGTSIAYEMLYHCFSD